MKNPEHKHRKNARRILAKHGYRVGGHVTTAEKSAIIKAVHQHEKADHPGKPATKIKLKKGGRASGGCARPRADKRARGGKSRSGHKTIVVVNGGQQQPPRPVPVPVPAARGPMPPPGAAPPGGAMPPPAAARPPMPPPGPNPGTMPMRKRGGSARHHAGAQHGRSPHGYRFG